MLTFAVSIYNMEQYLPRCVNTLLSQTYRNFEILLINDGSADGSGAMCDGYAAEYPELIRVIHKKNGGLSSARNAGIDAARGEYIIFPDPDDWVEPEYAAKLLVYRNQFNVDLVCTGYYVNTENSCTSAKQSSQSMIMTGKDAQKALLLPPKLSGFAWNKLYRLDIIRDNNLCFLDDVGITEDLDFTYRYLAFCQEVCFSPSDQTYHYFQRDGAATRSGFSKRKMDSLHTYEKIIADCEETMPDLAQAARDELCTTAVNLIWMYENSDCHDPALKEVLLHHIRHNLPAYLKGKRYGMGRKIQTVLAGYCPSVYAHLKNAVQKQHREETTSCWLP